MKTIENRKFKLWDQEISYQLLIKTSTNSIPKDWFTVDLMKQRLRIQNVIEEEKDTYNFEDSDFEVLKWCVNEMKWSILSQDIVDFAELFK